MSDVQAALPAANRALRRLGDVASAALPIGRFLAARATRRKFPLAVTLCLTNRCNFRCDYCHMPLTHRSELSTDEWCRAIDEFRAAGMARCSLMGGEPLLRKDVGAIIHHLRRRGVHSAMNTNGWLVEDKLDDVARLQLVCVGLDGPEAIHDRQRKKQGSYRRALCAIELLRGRGVEVVTMTPVTVGNVDHLDHVLRLARDLGFRAGFQIEHAAECDVREPIGPGLDDDRLADLAATLLARKLEGWPVAVSTTFLERFARRGRRMLASCAECQVPRYSCMVRPDGLVVPCFLTQHQGPMRSGVDLGFARAFMDVAQPTDAGCSSQPLMELHAVLGLEPEAVLSALRLT